MGIKNEDYKEAADTGLIFFVIIAFVAIIAICIYVPIIGKIIVGTIGIAFVLWMLWSVYYTIKHWNK